MASTSASKWVWLSEHPAEDFKQAGYELTFRGMRGQSIGAH
jgi:hypothetical protein